MFRIFSDVLGNTIRIMEAKIGDTMLNVSKPDVLIRPDVGYISFMEFNKAQEAIDTRAVPSCPGRPGSSVRLTGPKTA